MGEYIGYSREYLRSVGFDLIDDQKVKVIESIIQKSIPSAKSDITVMTENRKETFLIFTAVVNTLTAKTNHDLHENHMFISHIYNYGIATMRLEIKIHRHNVESILREQKMELIA